VLTPLSRHNRMVAVVLVWRSNVHRVNTGRGTELAGILEGHPAEVANKSIACFLSWICSPHYTHLRMGDETRQHRRGSSAQPDNADAEKVVLSNRGMDWQFLI